MVSSNVFSSEFFKLISSALIPIFSARRNLAPTYVLHDSSSPSVMMAIFGVIERFFKS